MLVAREETFGPLAPLFRFDTEDEAIQMANDTEYGLVAYLYTKDMSRGLRVSEQLDFGMTGLNRGLASDPAATKPNCAAMKPPPSFTKSSPPRMPKIHHGSASRCGPRIRLAIIPKSGCSLVAVELGSGTEGSLPVSTAIEPSL